MEHNLEEPLLPCELQELVSLEEETYVTVTKPQVSTNELLEAAVMTAKEATASL